MSLFLALFLHLLAAVVWIGGMAFALLALRPSLAAWDTMQRAVLWEAVLTRFFRFVAVAVALLLGTGLWMIHRYYGGMAGIPAYVHVMMALGILMMLIYGHALFAPFRRLKAAVGAQDAGQAARAQGQLRWLFTVNLVLGVLVLAAVAAGRSGVLL